jgi:hypothetical protein
MKIEFNEHVMVTAAIIGVVIVFSQIGSCLKIEQLGENEKMKAHIVAGQCEDKWGTWSQCK